MWQNKVLDTDRQMWRPSMPWWLGPISRKISWLYISFSDHIAMYRSHCGEKKNAIYGPDVSAHFGDVFLHYSALFKEISLFPRSRHILLPICIFKLPQNLNVFCLWTNESFNFLCNTLFYWLNLLSGALPTELPGHRRSNLADRYTIIKYCENTVADSAGV
jgi:hypothetical protein